VWLRVEKGAGEMEFFTKGAEGEDWVSGGVDNRTIPNYTFGNYKVGIFAKSWGGSIDSSFTIDFFDIPEFNVAVESAGKLATTWSAIRK